jgi:PilZ domain
MADARPERRRAKRVQPATECRLALSVSLPVKVLDASRSGVLLGSKTELAIGERAELRASVGPRSLTVTIEIRHLSTDLKARGGLQYRAGAVFVMLTAEQRLLLEQLLGAEPT